MYDRTCTAILLTVVVLLTAIVFLSCILVENKMNHVRSSGGTTVQIRASGSQSDPNSVGKNTNIA